MVKNLEEDHSVVPREPTKAQKKAFVKAAALSAMAPHGVESDEALQVALRSTRAAIAAGEEMGLRSDKTFQAVIELVSPPVKPNPIKAMINHAAGLFKRIFVTPK